MIDCIRPCVYFVLGALPTQAENIDELITHPLFSLSLCLSSLSSRFRSLSLSSRFLSVSLSLFSLSLLSLLAFSLSLFSLFSLSLFPLYIFCSLRLPHACSCPAHSFTALAEFAPRARGHAGAAAAADGHDSPPPPRLPLLLLLPLLLPPQQRAGAVFYDAETLPGQTLAPRRRSHSPENSRHLQVNVLFACPETVLANGWVFKEKVVFPKGFPVSPPLHHAQPFGRHWCHAARQQHHSARIERPFDQLMRCACYSLESVWVKKMVGGWLTARAVLCKGCQPRCSRAVRQRRPLGPPAPARPQPLHCRPAAVPAVRTTAKKRCAEQQQHSAHVTSQRAAYLLRVYVYVRC